MGDSGGIRAKEYGPSWLRGRAPPGEEAPWPAEEPRPSGEAGGPEVGSPVKGEWRMKGERQ